MASIGFRAKTGRAIVVAIAEVGDERAATTTAMLALRSVS